jgi:hypothetical protein
MLNQPKCKAVKKFNDPCAWKMKLQFLNIFFDTWTMTHFVLTCRCRALHKLHSLSVLDCVNFNSSDKSTQQQNNIVVHALYYMQCIICIIFCALNYVRCIPCIISFAMQCSRAQYSFTISYSFLLLFGLSRECAMHGLPGERYFPVIQCSSVQKYNWSVHKLLTTSKHSGV